MDRVYIRDLRIEAIVGIYDWERQVRQVLSLDIEVATEVAGVAAADDISLAVDYGALAQRLTDLVQVGEYRLLETLAEDAAAMVFREFSVPWLKLRVGKPGAVGNAEDVGIIIERDNPRP